jgi:hypothetical protein
MPSSTCSLSGAPKSQGGRKSKVSAAKVEESESSSVPPSSVDASDRSVLAEKTFAFKSDDELTDDDTPARKTPSMKIKLKKQTSNDSSGTPPAKRRHVRKSAAPADESKTNGSAASHPPTHTDDTSLPDGDGSGKKRARSRISKPSVIASNGDNLKADSPPTAGKASPQRKSITKPQAFTDKVRFDHCRLR